MSTGTAGKAGREQGWRPNFPLHLMLQDGSQGPAARTSFSPAFTLRRGTDNLSSHTLHLL